MNNNTRLLEAELAFGLERIAILLDCGLDFQTVLEIIAKEDGEFSRFAKKVLQKEKTGFELGKALLVSAKEYNSDEIKRAASRIISAYRSGEKGEKVEKIADDLILKQEHKIKEYSSKSAMFGLIFMVLTVLLPTVSIVIYFVGGFSLGFEISTMQLGIWLLILLPALCFSILFISKKQAPLDVYEKKQNDGIFIIGIITLIIALSFQFGIFAILPVLAIAGGLVFLKYKEEIKKEKLEEEIPDMLLQVSELEGLSFQRILREIGNSGYLEISKEFEKSYSQHSSNVGFEKIIEDMKTRTGSKLFSRTISLLKYVFESRKFQLCARMAQNIFRYFEIKRERASALSMQKYTLIMGSVIIPVILTTSSKMLADVGKIMGSAAENEVVLGFFIPVYLIIYSGMAGYYIMEIEGKKSTGMFYYLLMIFFGLGLYFFMCGN
ncbi:MAG: type II secretion system F family protein [Candidatus Micrarchaeia archaeon]